MTKKDEQTPAEHLRELVGSFSTAMLVTHSPGCSMHARPMTVAGMDDEDALWFATRLDSVKTAEVLVDPRVAVVMQGHASFVSVTGLAVVVLGSTAKVRELWSEAWRPWFPGGASDPQLALLRVEVEEAAFWDYRGLAGVRYVLDQIKHVLKGEAMDDGAGNDAYQRVSR